MPEDKKLETSLKYLEAVANSKTAPEPSLADALTAVLIDQLSVELKNRLAKIEETQKLMLAVLEKMARPKEYEYHIRRHQLDGRIEGITVKQKKPQG